VLLLADLPLRPGKYVIAAEDEPVVVRKTGSAAKRGLVNLTRLAAGE
jgi:hypothetical protein